MFNVLTNKSTKNYHIFSTFHTSDFIIEELAVSCSKTRVKTDFAGKFGRNVMSHRDNLTVYKRNFICNVNVIADFQTLLSTNELILSILYIFYYLLLHIFFTSMNKSQNYIKFFIHSIIRYQTNSSLNLKIEPSTI